MKLVEPDWSGVPGPFVTEAVKAEITVDTSGDPLDINASGGVPDNVVSAIMRSHFAAQRMPRVFNLEIPVRRPLAGWGERLMNPFVEEGENNEAERLSPGKLQKLDRKAELSDDSSVKEDLLKAYTFSASADPGQARKRRAELILWFIESKPDYGVLSGAKSIIDPKAGVLADPEGFERVAAAWHAAVLAHPANTIVLAHAVNFLQFHDPASALRLIDQNPDWGERLRWKGRICALRAAGASGFDSATGKVQWDEAAVYPAARNELLSSESLSFVLSALWTISLEHPASSFCRDLLAHAKSLFVDTKASCDSPEVRSGSFPRLTKKVEPEYPYQVRPSRISGTVTFRAVIDDAGHVANLELLNGLFMFYKNARSSLLKWKFTPATRNGLAVAAPATITVTFRIGP